VQAGAERDDTGDFGRRRQEQSQVWDRIGRMLESLGSVGGTVVERNLDLWNDVSTRLQREDYDSRELLADTARMMTVGWDNALLLWSAWSRPQPRERTAADLPTAFLFFDRKDPGDEHTLVDPVLIPVPREETRELPPRAEIVLGGRLAGSESAGADGAADKGVKGLLACLHARLEPGRGYWIETYRPIDDEPLVPGAYDGVVYLNRPPRPLATLRIIVDGPPPVVVT
jgi:hypothetical protein